MKRILCLSLLLLVFFFSTIASADRGARRKITPSVDFTDFYNTSAALVIGNGDYKNGWSYLPGALRDAGDVAAALKDHGFTVVLKKNLTKNQFISVLLRFIQQYGRDRNNRLLFYYSGHGHTETLATGDQAGYLVMVDAGNPNQDPFAFEMGSVPMQDLLTRAKMIHSKHVLFLFDSCFSGNILNSRGNPAPRYVSDATRKPVRQFITAGSAEEPVPDQSIFKTLFLDMLNGEREEPIPDGYLTGEELGMYLKQNLPRYNGNQHPQYGKINDPRLDKGDFVFFLKKKEPQPVQEQQLAPLRPATLTVRTSPQNARVKILHIKPKYRAGMALAAGTYTLEVRAPDYQSQQRQVKLVRGKALVEDFILKPEEDGMPEPVVAVVTPRPQRLAQTFTDATTGMKFVLVKGGCYQMGDTFGEGYKDEKPVHEVCVDDFYMGRYEVTQGEWQKIMGSNPSRFKNGDHYPVEKVSWNDITENFLPKLNRRSGKSYRLPTEAEWEYAAREGGKKVRFGNGKDIADPREINFDGSAEKKKSYSRTGVYREKTTKVGSFTPNSLGLYDMSGNVWEWCSDWYGKNYYDSSSRNNPEGLGSGSNRVLRGGSWFFNPRYVRAANRFYDSPDNSIINLGFRLVFPVH